jgi:hypothetical protein
VPDPAEIQQQIEQTRAELASTIDAIADRLSPKRVASRSVDSVKAKVEDLRSKGTPQPIPAGNALALPAAAAAASGQQPLPNRVASQLRTAKETRGKSVRWDRVGIAAGAVGLLALLRKRRSKAKASTKDKAKDKVQAKAQAAQAKAKDARKAAKKKAKK